MPLGVKIKRLFPAFIFPHFTLYFFASKIYVEKLPPFPFPQKMSLENIRKIFLDIDKSRQMRLRAFIHHHSKKATPFAVHIFMLLGVTMYTIFGAMIMQRIESETIQGLRLYQQQQFRTVQQQQKTSMIGKREIAIIHEDSGEQRQHQIRHIRKFLLKRDQQLECITNMIRSLDRPECNITKLRHQFEQCRKNEISSQNESNEKNEIKQKIVTPQFGWTFTDSVLFCFTIITTIGYGNVAPKTFSGQLFCILYALIGIPFTLLAIADLGKFLSEILESWEKACVRIKKRLIRFWRQFRGRPKFSFVSLMNSAGTANNLNQNGIDPNNNFDGNISTSKKNTPTIVILPEEQMAMLDRAEKGEMTFLGDNGSEIMATQSNGDTKKGATDVKRDSEVDELKSEQSADQHFEHSQAIPLLIFFLLYVFAGSCLLNIYEPDMNFFKAIYFNFVSLTSIGLGDVVPQSETYMALTLLYIAVGLALTTIAIEIAADYLKKLHYFGRKIENVGNVVIWFGGKKLTMKQLVKNLGDQFNLPVHQVKTLDLDKFVDDAIKVEEGELETLRPAPIEPKDLLEEGTLNFADDDTEIEEWIRQKTPSTSPEPEQQDEPEPEPEFESESEMEIEGPAAELESESEDEPQPSADPEPQPNLSPEPSEKETEIPEPEIEKEPEIIPESENVKEPELEPIIPVQSDAELESIDAGTSQFFVGTTTPDMERRKSNYSEEAWRRYLEYQKQWKKFRHTQTKNPPPQMPTEFAERKRSSLDTNRRPSSSIGSSQGSFASGTPQRELLPTKQSKKSYLSTAGLPPSIPSAEAEKRRKQQQKSLDEQNFSPSPKPTTSRFLEPKANQNKLGVQPNEHQRKSPIQPKRSTASSKSGGSMNSPKGSKSPRKMRTPTEQK